MSEPLPGSGAGASPDSRASWFAPELRQRLRTAALLIPPAIGILLAGGWIYVATLSVMAAVGVRELQGLLRAKGLPVQPQLALVGAALVPWVAYSGAPGALAAFLTAVLLSALIRQLVEGPQGALAGVAGSFFAVFYVGWLLSYAVFLRFFPVQWPELGLHPGSGCFFVLLALLSAVGADAGGYFVGRRFGRRKLAPSISPGKTVEGALGAGVCGVALALLALAILRAVAEEWTGGVSVWAIAVGAAVVAGAAIVGDLIESVLKRDAARKDAGHLLPGVGGILDRIDSWLLALPVLYYWLLGYYALSR